MKHVSCFLGRLQNSVLAASSRNSSKHWGVGWQSVCAVNNGCILPKTLATVLPPPYIKIFLREVTSQTTAEQEDLRGRHVFSWILRPFPCLFRIFMELGESGYVSLWNFFLELKPLEEKYPENFELEFSTAQPSRQCQLLLDSPWQSLCINTPCDTICLPADIILRCLHGQNLEKWAYCANHFRSELGPNPELVLSEVASLH